LLPAGPELDAPSELERVDAWLALCEALADHERPALHRLGFFDRHQMLLADLAAALDARVVAAAPAWQLAAAALARLARLVPDAVVAPTIVEDPGPEPVDPSIDAPRRLDAELDVDRILRDLA
jgi:hypothetical protein